MTVSDQRSQRSRLRPPDGPATITAVVPSYNVAPLLERCLAALRQSDAELRTRGDRLDVVVVDNASRDGSADLVRQRFPGSPWWPTRTTAASAPP